MIVSSRVARTRAAIVQIGADTEPGSLDSPQHQEEQYMGSVIDFYAIRRGTSHTLPPNDPDEDLLHKLVDEQNRLKLRVIELDRLIEMEISQPE